MRIDKINVSGYRRFNDSTINLEHGNFAILAGANNSGKTSLIQLLDFVFNNSLRRSLSFNDFSISLKSLLDERIKKLNLSSNFDEDEFMNFIDYIDENIKIKFQIILSYDVEESIGLFANYLMDLENDMHSFYFEYNYRLNTKKIREEFIEQDIRSAEILQEIIERNTESIYFYADQNFNNKKTIEYKEFKKLFHFEYISADRELDDENLKNKKITTSIISSADSTKRDSIWGNKFDYLKNKIANDLTESEIDLSVQKETQKVLSALKDSLDNVSKNEIEALEAKFNFNEKNLLNLIKDSFLNNFLKPFFRNEKVIDYYLEIYKEEIEVILKGETKLIERYKERFQIEGEVSEETVKSNLDEIYYNERQNSFVLDGGLSHDDLLNFSFKLIERFPKIGFKLREMYNYIFIDEVQDTSADILRFFYNSAKGSSTKVYFLGDKMQEIYNKYDGSFEDEYAEFDDTISQKFPKNYRSSKEIVDLLNNLYLSSYKVEQDSDKGEKGQLPQIVFTDNIENYLSDNSEVYEEFYKLRTVNIKRFENIDNSGKSADDIYKKYQKLYPNNGRISVMDTLVIFKLSIISI